MDRPAAPDAVLEFTQCHCNTSCSSRRCSCKREDLVCTDTCGCDETLCENKEMYTNDDDQKGLVNISVSKKSFQCYDIQSKE